MPEDRGIDERTVREFEGRLRAFVAKRVPTATEVDDVVQDVLARMHSHLESVRDSSRTSSWIFRVASNAISDHYRAVARRAERDVDVAEHVAPKSDPADAARRDLAQCLVPFVNRLEEPYREALRRVDLEGESQIDVARELGLSISGMKSRVQRGREQLKQMLQRCCAFEFDRRGRIVDFEKRPATNQGPCATDTSCSCSGPIPKDQHP